MHTEVWSGLTWARLIGNSESSLSRASVRTVDGFPFATSFAWPSTSSLTSRVVTRLPTGKLNVSSYSRAAADVSAEAARLAYTSMT